MSKPEEYGICIRLIRQDDADLYEGRVNELPDLKVYGETYSEAYEELIGAIDVAQELFAEQGRAFPSADPIEDAFSGRITLRMSKSMHRCVHEKAARDGVSLNQWIVEAVGYRVAPSAAPAPSKAETIYVISPVLQSSSAAPKLCIQQAARFQTVTTSNGSAVHILMTTGAVDFGSASQSPHISTNQWRAMA
jgi:predicted HicB family RNase H-like nuclease